MSTKTGIASISERRSDLLHIDPRNLHVKIDWNARDITFDPKNEDDLALAHSIASIGVQQPLTVYWESGTAFVSDGHRRLAAALYALTLNPELKTVPVRTEDRGTSEADRVLSMVIRNSGKPLSALEQGKVFKRLLDFGWAIKDIALKTGWTSPRISQILDLLTMPEDVKGMVSCGQISPTLAMEVVKEKGSEAGTTISAAVETAKESGRKRAMPKDFGEDGRQNFKTVLKDAFDNSDVNDESDTDVVITMPIADYMRVRDILKL